MRSWWSLYKKDLSAKLFFMLVVVLLVTGWQFFLFYKLDNLPEVSFGLSFLPFAFFPFLILWLGYSSFKQEWKDNTIYFLLSLPRTGWQLTLSKLAAGMTFYFSVSIYTTILIYFFHRNRIGKFLVDLPELPLTRIITWIVIIYIMYGLTIYILIQFSQLVSQFYDRFQGFISLLVFLISSHITFRGGSILAPLFKWAPDIPIESISEFYGQVNVYTIYLGTGPLIGSLVVLVLFFMAGSWLLENQLEV